MIFIILILLVAVLLFSLLCNINILRFGKDGFFLSSSSDFPWLNLIFGKLEKYAPFNSFGYLPYTSSDNDLMYLGTHTQFPFWNVQLGSKKNMSYDLRGDVPITPGYVGPWNLSSTQPIYNKPLAAVS